MCKKSYSNLVHCLLFASLVASVHLTAAQYRRDDSSSEENSESISDESTEEPVPTNADKQFSIRSEFGSKRVLDISGSDAGAILILQDPQNIPSQQWYLDSDGWTIRSKLNDLCLKSKGPYPAMVTLGPCGRRGNKFVQTVDNQIEMLYKDDVCLDVSAGNESLGGYVMAKECDCSTSIRSNQKWSFDYADNVKAARGKINAGRKNEKKSEESIKEPDTTDEDECGWTSLEELGSDPISARRRTIHRITEEPDTSDEDSVESTEEPNTNNEGFEDSSEECSNGLYDESSEEKNTRKAMKKQRKNQDSEEGIEEPDTNNDDYECTIDESSEESNTRKAMKKQRKHQDTEEGTEEPDTNNDKPFTIQSEFGSKRVLGISDSGNGVNVILEDPQNTASQQWYIDSDGWTIRSKLNRLCLNSNGPSPSEVIVGPCGASGTHGSRRGNKFVYNHLRNQIENYKDDMCLDISADNDQLGANVMTKKCNVISSNKLNQKWSFDYTTNVEKARKPKKTVMKKTGKSALFIIRTRMDSKMVVDAEPKRNVASPDEASVGMNDYDKNAISQKWYIGDDKTIRSALNDYCLISKGDFPLLVTVEPCAGAKRYTKWVYISDDEQIKLATNPSKCLELVKPGCWNKHALSNLVEYHCHRSLNQKWTLENDDSMV